MNYFWSLSQWPFMVQQFKKFPHTPPLQDTLVWILEVLGLNHIVITIETRKLKLWSPTGWVITWMHLSSGSTALRFITTTSTHHFSWQFQSKALHSVSFCRCSSNYKGASKHFDFTFLQLAGWATDCTVFTKYVHRAAVQPSLSSLQKWGIYLRKKWTAAKPCSLRPSRVCSFFLQEEIIQRQLATANIHYRRVKQAGFTRRTDHKHCHQCDVQVMLI